MANFKKLSDVEISKTLSDTSNVLIEEGGIIKKANSKLIQPSSAKYDAVFEIVEGHSGYFYSVDLISGSYKILKEIIDKGERAPNILVKYSSSYERAAISPFGVICATDPIEGGQPYIRMAIYI